MQKWAQDLLNALDQSVDAPEMYQAVQAASARLGFEWCAFGLRIPRPLLQPAVTMLNNYPASWRQRYEAAGYLAFDPSVARGGRSPRAFLWTDSLFGDTPTLWQEAQDVGLRVGWAQSCFAGDGTGSLLSLSRSKEPLCEAELVSKALQLNWLVSLAHEAFSRMLASGCTRQTVNLLTLRELEVLKWAAAGKTTEDTAAILAISIDTAKFHIKNAIAKLDAPNKVAAVVRAMALGLLN